jgi:hypothetical protein
MSDLVIRIKKKTDGAAALSCQRADGSVTWQRQDGAQGRFFPWHDLTHYAVEAELGFRNGFFGLIAQGWDVDDTGGKRARGPLPSEAITVEHIVGGLDAERASLIQLRAAEFNAQVAPGRPFTDAELVRVRARRRELFAQWAALPAGETLELRFPVATAASARP